MQVDDRENVSRAFFSSDKETVRNNEVSILSRRL